MVMVCATARVCMTAQSRAAARSSYPRRTMRHPRRRTQAIPAREGFRDDTRRAFAHMHLAAVTVHVVALRVSHLMLVTTVVPPPYHIQAGLCRGCLFPFLRVRELVRLGSTCKALLRTVRDDASWEAVLAHVDGFSVPEPAVRKKQLWEVFRDWVLAKREKKVRVCVPPP